MTPQQRKAGFLVLSAGTLFLMGCDPTHEPLGDKTSASSYAQSTDSENLLIPPHARVLPKAQATATKNSVGHQGSSELQAGTPLSKTKKNLKYPQSKI
jgi:hypothetical protein